MLSDFSATIGIPIFPENYVNFSKQKTAKTLLSNQAKSAGVNWIKIIHTLDDVIIKAHWIY